MQLWVALVPGPVLSPGESRHVGSPVVLQRCVMVMPLTAEFDSIDRVLLRPCPRVPVMELEEIARPAAPTTRRDECTPTSVPRDYGTLDLRRDVPRRGSGPSRTVRPFTRSRRLGELFPLRILKQQRESSIEDLREIAV